MRSTLVLACLVALSHSVSAAPSARRLLDEGNRLFSAGDYEAAFERFETGYRKQPRPVFLRSMAFCQLKLSNHEEAQTLLQRYLEHYPDAGDASRIKRNLADLDIIVRTRIAVDSEPPGAMLYIDTEAAGQRGVTPYSGTIEPGEHEVILRKDGYRTTTRRIEIQPRERKAIRVPLELGLSVASRPVGARVYIDELEGTPRGVTPLLTSISPGEHRLKVVLAGYAPFLKSFSAQPGPPTTITAELEVPLRVVAVPADAKVYLDGREVAQGSPAMVTATPGRHEIRAEREGYQPAEEVAEFWPSGEGASEREIILRLRGGLLSMRTTPPGAQARVGELNFGPTPFERASVPLGRRQVTVSHSDRRAWEQAVTFEDGQVVRSEIELGRSLWPTWVALGVAAAGLVTGITTGILADRHTDRANESDRYMADGSGPLRGWCSSGGEAIDGAYKDAGLTEPVTGSDCGFGNHHAATAGFVTAGVASAAALAYYYFFARPESSMRVEAEPADVGAEATERALSTPAQGSAKR